MITMLNMVFFKVCLGVLGAIKEPIHCSKLAVECVLITLAIYSCFIERLQYGGELFKKEPVMWCKLIVFNAVAMFWHVSIAELLNTLLAINGSYN